jgi:hypothetical protein
MKIAFEPGVVLQPCGFHRTCIHLSIAWQAYLSPDVPPLPLLSNPGNICFTPDSFTVVVSARTQRRQTYVMLLPLRVSEWEGGTAVCVFALWQNLIQDTISGNGCEFTLWPTNMNGNQNLRSFRNVGLYHDWTILALSRPILQKETGPCGPGYAIRCRKDSDFP